MKQFHTNLSVNITELKKDPIAVLKQAKGKPVAILNRDVPVAYLFPPKVYAAMLDILKQHGLLNDKW